MLSEGSVSNCFASLMRSRVMYSTGEIPNVSRKRRKKTDLLMQAVLQRLSMLMGRDRFSRMYCTTGEKRWALAGLFSRMDN